MTSYSFWYQSGDFSCHQKTDISSVDNCAMHTHDTIEIYYFISGDCDYLVEGTQYCLTPEDILIMRPFEAHKLIYNSSKVPYERVIISISPELLLKIDPSGSLLSPMLNRPLGTGNRFTIKDFGHSLCSDCIRQITRQADTITRIELISRTILVLSQANTVLKRSGGAVRAGDVGAKLIDYVNQNLFSQISLEQLSREFFMSQSQINRIFKHNTGSSVGRYITAKRLLAARRRIRNGESASQVCVECGYNDYSAFYRAYLKRFNTSPQCDKIGNL